MDNEQSRIENSEHSMSGDELRSRLLDPSYLPSYKDLSQRFEALKDYTNTGNDERNKWRDFVGREQVFEIWTEEYINALTDYLSERISNLGSMQEQPAVILEVGAGDGRLSHFLQQKLNERIPGKVKVVPSDSGEMEIKPAFPVENIDQKKALAQYKPKIVIASWMPHEVDWSADFRAEDSVDEYILIGETGSGCCGDEWLTWGQGASLENPAPYEVDDFERIDQPDLTKFQLSHINVLAGKSTTSTTSFRRNKNI